MWNIVSGELLFTYAEHAGPVTAISWSPTSRLLASAGIDRTVQVWNATTGERIFTYDVHKGSVNTVSWAPDGKYIASGCNDGTTHIWETRHGYRTFIYAGDTERVPARSHTMPTIAQGYFGRDVQVTWGYVVDNATGVVLTPSDYLPL